VLLLSTAAGSAPVPGTVTVSPASGAAGSTITVSGTVTCVAATQVIALVGGGVTLTSKTTNDGAFSVTLTVPATATVGTDQVTSTCDGASATLGTFAVIAATTTTTAGPTTTTTAAPTTTTTTAPPATVPPAPAAGAVTATPRFTG
jgi:hypothetical protein